MLTFALAAALAVTSQGAVTGPKAAPDVMLVNDVVSDRVDPGTLINRGIVYARAEQVEMARALFEAARDSDQWIDLQVPSGDWVDSRMLARRALMMLKRGDFSQTATIAAR